MIDRRTLVAASGAAGILALFPRQLLAQDQGRFVDLGTLESKHIAPTKVTVWLPPGYDSSKQRYGVVYMNDGQNLFDPKRSGYNKVWAADKSALRLIASGRVRPFVIIGIDHPGEDRYRQYFPAPMLELVTADMRAELVKFSNGPITADNYLDFLVRELKPLIDQRFRTRTGPKHTGIVGSSMGGLVSLYAVTARPEIFGLAGCVSTHLPLAGPEWSEVQRSGIFNAWRQYARLHLGKPKGRRIWFDHGTETLDAFYRPYQQVFDAALVANGWRKGRDFSSRVYEGTPHEENAWAARLDHIFGWMLKGR